jgi:hypothetical protein
MKKILQILIKKKHIIILTFKVYLYLNNILYRKDMKVPNRIAINAKICAGKPCIRGTRLSVDFILE